MTFDDDMVQFEFDHGVIRQPCIAMRLSWPPPELIHAFGFEMKRTRMSIITDEQRASMTHVIRGAVYEPLPSKLGQAPVEASNT